MKVISDMDDASYFEKRAIELIHQAGADRITVLSCSIAKNVPKEAEYKKRYHDNLNKAIQLLTLARIVES